MAREIPLKAMEAFLERRGRKWHHGMELGAVETVGWRKLERDSGENEC